MFVSNNDDKGFIENDRLGSTKISLSKTGITLSLVSAFIFFLIQLVGIFHHEPFCDEYQAFQISLDSHSISELFFNMRQEGHPAAWYLILFSISHFSHSLFAMELIHIIIASTGIFILFRFAPFSLLEKILISTGYFFFYEYAQISREYVIGLFCIMAFCAVIGEKYYKRKLSAQQPLLQPSLFYITALLLFLLSNGSTYGLILSFPLAAYLLWMVWDERKIILQSRKLKISFAISAFILLLGWIIVYFQLKPPPDNDIPRGFNLSNSGIILPQILTAYFPFPKLNTISCRDTYFIDIGNPLILNCAAIVLVILIAFSFVKKPEIFFLYLASTIAVAVFIFYVNSFWSASRYSGHFFVALIVCFWLEKYVPSNQNILNFLPDKIIDKLKKCLFYFILITQTITGFYFYYLDFNYPFSNISAVGDYIIQHHFERFPLMGGRDNLVLPLSYYTNKPIYTIDRSDTSRFVIWDKKRKLDMEMREFFKEVNNQVDKSKNDTILLTLTTELLTNMNGENQPVTEGSLDRHHYIKYVYKVDDPTINMGVGDAGYYLYIVWKTR